MLPNNALTVLAIDTETHTPQLKELGTRCIQGDDYAIGISVAAPDGFSAYYPLRHNEGNGDPSILNWLRWWLAEPTHLAIFAHAKFDIEMLWSLGVDVKCRCYDVLAVDALIDENQNDYSLNGISRRYGLDGKTNKAALEQWMIDNRITMPHNRKKPCWGRMREVPPDVIRDYAVDDAELTLSCYVIQQTLIAEQKLERVVKLECDLIPVIWAMRLEGVPVDLHKAELINVQMQAQGDIFLKNLRTLSPKLEPFAARSLEVFVNSYGIYPPRTAKNNEPSITNEWLETLEIPELQELGRYREAEKVRRDFIEGVVLQYAHKGKIHPSWSSTRGGYFKDDPSGTRTGRLSCDHPNLAQIPSRHPTLGPLMRSMFVPRPGEVWHKADYASQEPRITLHYAYKYDLPGAADVANRYFLDKEVDYHQITTDMMNAAGGRKLIRKQGKEINLGLVYGLGKDKLAYKLLVDRDEVEPILDNYHRAVPYVKPLQEKTQNFARTKGFITTELGRRRRFDLWESARFGQRTTALPRDEAAVAYKNRIKRAGTYKALNACVQGTAAEQIKSAMVQLHAEGLTPLITLYDELGHSIPEDPKISLRICEVMENAIPLFIPHHVEALMGPSWDLKKT